MATHSSILPEESHEQRSLEGYSPWGCKGSDMSQLLNNNKLVSLPDFFRFTVQFSSVQSLSRVRLLETP